MLNRADYNFVVKYGEVTPDGVAVYDLNSRTFVYLNRFLRQMLGLGENQKVGTGESIKKLVHPDDLDYVERCYRELLSIGCISPAEFRVQYMEGQVKHLLAEVLWLEDSYTFALIVKDITALRDHEEYVVKISAQKDTLLDMLLHNLSAPLYLSRDLLALLATSTDQQKETGRVLTLMNETTMHCIDIIQQFLQEEHTQSLDVTVSRTRFSVLEKTRLVLDMLREMNPAKRFVMESDLSDAYIMSDRVKFFQIVHNLLSNAVKYTEDDGLIRVEFSSENNRVVIVVSDNGTGVPVGIRDQLFSQRVQGIPGVNGEPSNGMGLLICSQLTRLLGGSITFEPGKKNGSVFTLTLPKE